MQKTIQNLTKAFIGESQARNRYTMYAKIAKKEGYEQISANFELTADQETEHAKWLMRMINDLKDGDSSYDEIKVEVSAPTTLGTTKENLQAAIAGENYEHTDMYPEFAKVASEEKLPEIFTRLNAIAKAEKNHEDRFKNFFNELENNTVFKKDEEVIWVCKKCGYMHSGKEVTEKCPSCGHPQAYFEVKACS